MIEETDGQQPAPVDDVQTPEPAPVENEQVEATNTDDDSDNGDETAAQPETGNKPARGVQKRLDELTRQKHEAAREAEYWRQQAQALTERLPTPQPTQSAPEKPLTLEAFDYDEAAYQAAVMKSYETHATTAAERAIMARQQEAEQAAKAAEFDARIAEARTRYADFDEVVFSPSVTISPDMAEALKALPDGADVAYKLASDPKEARRIASLPPVLQAVEIGRIASRAAASPQTKPTPPAPPSGLSGIVAGAAPKDPAKMTMAEYAAWRKANP